jgi:hypothetical protein
MPSGLAAGVKSDASLRTTHVYERDNTFSARMVLLGELVAVLFVRCCAVPREFHHLTPSLSNISIAAMVSNETMTYLLEIDRS